MLYMDVHYTRVNTILCSISVGFWKRTEPLRLKTFDLLNLLPASCFRQRRQNIPLPSKYGSHQIPVLEKNKIPLSNIHSCLNLSFNFLCAVCSCADSLHSPVKMDRQLAIWPPTTKYLPLTSHLSDSRTPQISKCFGPCCQLLQPSCLLLRNILTGLSYNMTCYFIMTGDAKHLLL